MTAITNAYVVGLSPTPDNNFLLDTDGAGALRIRRRADGSGGLLLNIDPSGNITGLNGIPLQRSQFITGKSVGTGTTLDFAPASNDGPPSWAKKATFVLSDVSTNGANAFIMQLGTLAGGIEVTGYRGANDYLPNSAAIQSANLSSSFTMIGNILAASSIHGIVTLALNGSNTWGMSSLLSLSGAAAGNITSGSKGLAGVLDRIRFTTVGGTDVFDTGTISVLYEG